jgi:hypothetical protein
VETGFDADGGGRPAPERLTVRTRLHRTQVTAGLASDLTAPVPRDLLAPPDDAAASLGAALETAHGIALAHRGGPRAELALARTARAGRPVAAGRLRLRDSGDDLALHAGLHGRRTVAGATARATPGLGLRLHAGLAVQHRAGRPAGTLSGARLSWDTPLGLAGRLTATIRQLFHASPQARLTWTAPLALGELSFDGRTAGDDPARIAAGWGLRF